MKKSFLLYHDMKESIDNVGLSYEQKGKLLEVIFCYHNGCDLPELDPLTNAAWGFMKTTFDRDIEKYEKLSAIRKKAGKLGGKASKQKKQMVAKEANGSNCDDSDSVSASDICSDIPDGKSAALWKKRPKACEPEQWQKYLDYSREFIEGQQNRWGKIAKINDSTLSNSAKALDNLIRIQQYNKNAVHETIEWAASDSFWSKQVISLGGLTRKSGKNDLIKFDNIVAARQSEMIDRG